MNINRLKKAFSFIWPVTTKVLSPRNGVLEISWYNGKKMLNSKNANYSYGSLEKALVFGLSKMKIKTEEPILLLGMGGGSVIPVLRNKFRCRAKITAVEWDETIIELAHDEFGIDDSLNVEVIHADASEYVKENTQRFGLIIVDLFSDKEVPEVFYSPSFWDNLIPMVKNGGSILFNAGINKRGDERISKVVYQLQKQANVQVLERVERTNTLVIAEFP